MIVHKERFEVDCRILYETCVSLARDTGLSSKTVANHIHKGMINAVEVNGKFYVTPGEAERYFSRYPKVRFGSFG